MLIIVRVESYERFDWLMGLWGKFAMSTEMFSGLILITGSRFDQTHRTHTNGATDSVSLKRDRTSAFVAITVYYNSFV